MRPTIVGEMPGNPEDDGNPIRTDHKGKSGERLQSFFGKSLHAYFDRVNLFATHHHEPPTDHQYRMAARNLRFVLTDKVVILLGNKVASSFELDLSKVNKFEFFRTDDTPYLVHCRYAVILPHPSGNNRIYNHSENRQRAAEVLTQSLVME